MITNPNKTMSLMANYWKGYGNEFARPYVLEYEEVGGYIPGRVL